MDTTSRFWDRTAPKYARMPIADEAAYQRKLEITRGYFRPDMELLELGCGTGSTAVTHAPHVRHITAIDFSRALLDIAEERARAAGVENITFLEADINAYGAPDERYDMVLAMSVLHLMKHPEEAIGRVHGMLKPGGYFVSSTACLGDTTLRLMKYIAPIGKALGKLPQLTVFTDSKLVSMVERQGFAIRHHWQPGRMAAVFIVAQKA
ncbi:SAM-dependent methyltransferase [Devosia geojensis]|uniref:SAM-dependent methyltransferase n=1 Tax=Devosia geojensis TaxID=443610 RepID=A0A0F5FQX1_9HYPH|nr:class I SAM-dependent methyltransferase [Devosia geojensis]KKB10985.1 SAM-dependent methyltransferase [Devosia geojensis]